MKKAIETVSVVLVGGVALLYLINPTMGVVELIPDNLPILGNLDEAGATAILLGVFAYFGFDLSRFFGRRVPRKEEPAVRERIVDVAAEEVPVKTKR